MKANPFSTLFSLVFFTFLLSCGEEHDHSDHSDHDHHGDHGEHGDHGHGHGHGKRDSKVGPNGGRMLLGVTPNAEFLLRKDSSIQLRFYENGKAVNSIADSVQVLIGGEPVELIRDRGFYVSKALKLEGPVSVTVKIKQQGQEFTEEFSLE